MKVNWNHRVAKTKTLHFANLDINDAFKIVGAKAVYIKVKENYGQNEWMMELATGRLFAPTLSPVDLVNVEVNIGIPKPSIYV